MLAAEDIGNYCASDSGTLIYIPQSAIADWASSYSIPVWVNREGKEEPLPVESNIYAFCKISPDGAQVAFTAGPAVNRMNLWVYDVKRETSRRLTFDSSFDAAPLWTADSKKLMYSSFAAGTICRKGADGAGEVERLGPEWELPHVLYPFSQSKDGKAIVLSEVWLSPFQADIGMISMEGDHAIKSLLQEKSNENYPQISPGGQWMAYQSDRSGRYEIYVCSFPDVNKGKYQVTTGGGDSPLWSPDGKELFYRNGDSYMAVDVETEPPLKYGKPEVLFKGAYSSNSNPHNYTFWDISPIDKRFLMIKPAAAEAKSRADIPRKISIVVNWFEELKQRVAAGK